VAREDLGSATALVADVLGGDRAVAFVRLHVEPHHLLVADEGGDILGCLAYRTDWFQCTLVELVSVAEAARRRGVARALYRRVEAISPSPRLYSSTEETNTVSIRMHVAFGFSPSGYIDNLPQGYRELLFFKRREP